MLSLELPRNGGAAPGTGLCRASCASAAQREVQLGLCGAVGGGAAPAGQEVEKDCPLPRSVGAPLRGQGGRGYCGIQYC